MSEKQRPEWVEEQLDRTRTSSKKRGSTDNKRRLAGFAKVDAANGADWGSCSAEKVLAVVTAITELGGAVIFGLSRDGGAHMLTLLLDNEKQPLWFNGDAVLDDELDMVLGTLESMK